VLKSKQFVFTPSTTLTGFTIVELLVVIVVIGILAAITIVSYTGITGKATIVSLESDLTNASKQLKMHQVENSAYPDTINCAIPDSSTNKCIESSSGNDYTYTPINNTTPQTFTLDATNGTTTYRITNDSIPVEVSTSLAISDPANWLAIGTQVWAKYNLNVGTMITGVTAQTNNSTLEKYCYDNNESNCTTYGAFYQWNEAMQYITTEGAQGICPTGSHIPSDTEYKTLEMQLGMSQAHADITGWSRGTDQGTQLKPSGSSGLNISLAGLRFTDGSFHNLLDDVVLWSSSESGTDAWDRNLNSNFVTVYRNTIYKDYGLSVRCVEN